MRVYIHDLGLAVGQPIHRTVTLRPSHTSNISASPIIYPSEKGGGRIAGCALVCVCVLRIRILSSVNRLLRKFPFPSFLSAIRKKKRERRRRERRITMFGMDVVHDGVGVDGGGGGGVEEERDVERGSADLILGIVDRNVKTTVSVVCSLTAQDAKEEAGQE